MVSAEALALCFRELDSKKQAIMLKLIKKTFDRDTPMSGENIKITWQIKHSFLHFLTVLLRQDSKYSKMVCLNYEECFIKMLANDQVDEITLCICQIIEYFIGEAYFTNQKIDRMNRQIWAIVENMDDLSVSARSTLNLLIQLFPYFKLNEGKCIQRLKKFFTSKIDEVRCELYKLISNLYGHKSKI